MTLVVPCLDNIFIVLLISELAKIGAIKPMFLDSGSPRGFIHAWAWFVIIVYFIYWIQVKNFIFFVSNSDLCSAMLPNYLRTYSSTLCQIRALEKTLKKQNNGQSVPKSWFSMHAQILVFNACIWLAWTNRQNWVPYFPNENDLCRAVLPDCLETLSAILCQISALKEAIG